MKTTYDAVFTRCVCDPGPPADWPLSVLMSTHRHHVKLNGRPGTEEQRTRGSVDFAEERGKSCHLGFAFLPRFLLV